MIKHGGHLAAIRKQYPHMSQQWLDLSTGVSPWSYPVGEIPESIWRSLPDVSSSNTLPIVNAAKHYYHVSDTCITPVAGTQEAIRLLPQLLPIASVAIPREGYQEHAYSWALAGHQVCYYDTWEALDQLLLSKAVSHCVIITPNNPTAEIIDSQRLQSIYQQISLRGYLLVDEAFIDSVNATSAVTLAENRPQLIVLRSIGKFFGLAGIRLGFVIGSGNIIEQLRHQLSPWNVSHPALYVGEKALRDSLWQEQQRQRIGEQEKYLCQYVENNHRLLSSLNHYYSAGLFITLFGDDTFLRNTYQKLVRQGILLRPSFLNDHTDSLSWLRLGLPGESNNLQRLLTALDRL